VHSQKGAMITTTMGIQSSVVYTIW